MIKRYLPVSLFTLLIILGLYYIYSASRSRATGLRLVTVRQGVLNPQVNIDGKIEAEKKADLVFDLVGRVTKLPVKVGDKVKKGDILAYIDSTDYSKNKDIALKDYMLARWDFEQARDDYDVGESVDRSTLNDTQKRIVEKQQFMLDKSVKNVEIYAHTLQDTYIYAPFSATVTNIDIDEGNYTSLTKPAITIQNLDSLKVTAKISEMDVTSLSVGKKLAFTLDAYPNMVFYGSISEIDPAETIIDGVVYYKTTIIPESLPPGARSGMSASITIEKMQKQALLLPLYAFQKIEGNVGSVKVQKNNDVTALDVTIGERGVNGMIEVVSGLNAGDQVIVDDLPD